jgi:hypothetical protein
MVQIPDPPSNSQPKKNLDDALDKSGEGMGWLGIWVKNLIFP